MVWSEDALCAVEITILNCLYWFLIYWSVEVGWTKSEWRLELNDTRLSSVADHMDIVERWTSKLKMPRNVSILLKNDRE